ncbi:MAG: Ig-like domain-containing protein [bacterium]|nr:Ig-like domain-containing protein [bacterium]
MASPTFSWQGNGDGTGCGIAWYDLYVGEALRKTVSGTTTSTTWNISSLGEGTHTWYWYVVARDTATNSTTSTSTFNISYDNAAPAVFNLTSPADNHCTRAASPVFSWENNGDGGCGIAQYHVVIDGDTKAVVSGSQTSTTINISGLAAGDHTWYVVAEDTATNTRQSTTSRTIKSDTTAPVAFALTSPADNYCTRAASPVFSWEGSSDGGCGIAQYHVVIDGDTKAVVSGSQTSTTINISGLAAGDHTWYVVAEDTATNTRQSTTSRTIKSDTTAPVAFDLTSPANNHCTNVASPTFSWQGNSDGSGCGIAWYYLVVDNVNTTTVSGIQTSTTFNLNPLGEGNHTWYVVAEDTATNTRQSTSNTLVFDVIEPNTTLTPHPDPTSDTTPTYSGHAADSTTWTAVSSQLFPE